jgi:hypothetical protein
LIFVKLIVALVFATASANFVQIGRTPVDTTWGSTAYDWVDVTFPTAFAKTVREIVLPCL